MHVLVAAGAGIIGGYLAEYLVKVSHNVTVLDQGSLTLPGQAFVAQL